MSRRWTNFVKGPNLQDTITSFSTISSSTENTTEKEDGLRVSQVYEEIISESSDSTYLKSIKTSTIRYQNQINETQIQNSISVKANAQSNITLELEHNIPKAKPKPKIPKFSTLLKLAERNDHGELSSILALACENEIVVHLNQQDEFGWTLLMVAACAGATECVKLLLQHGADWTIKDKKGFTALSLARKKRLGAVCNFIQNWEDECEERERERERLKRQSEAELKAASENSVCDISNEFCAPCQVETEDPLVHSRSIAHLLTTTEDVPEKIHYGIPESNRGFQLLLKTGWDRDAGGLGPEGKGQKFPVKTILKQDRIGLGNEESGKKRARITHFPAFDVSAVERQVKPEERIERKKTIAKKEDTKRKSREKRKEIDYRRELGSL